MQKKRTQALGLTKAKEVIMERKEDYRVVKTKRALVSALEELLRREKFEDITVNELCDAAGVRRATFYKHFKDKYDFLSYSVRAKRESFDREIWRHTEPGASCDYYVKYAEALISYFSENTDVASNIMRSDSSHSIIGMLVELNREDTKERLEVSVKDGLPLSLSTDTVANILTGGIALAVTRWFEGGMTAPKEKLIEEITHVIDSLLA